MKSVFDGFNFRRLDATHCAMSSMQLTRLCSASPASCCLADTYTAKRRRRRSASSPYVYSQYCQDQQYIKQTGVDPTLILEGLRTACGDSKTQCPQTAQCSSGLTSSCASNSKRHHVSQMTRTDAPAVYHDQPCQKLMISPRDLKVHDDQNSSYQLGQSRL